MDAKIQELLMNSDCIGSEKGDFAFPNNSFRYVCSAGKQKQQGGHAFERKGRQSKGQYKVVIFCRNQ